MDGSVFKGLLNQHCQKARVALPIYSTKSLQTSQGTPNFISTVQLFNGATYESRGSFHKKKTSEQDAAKHALVALGQISEDSVEEKSWGNSREEGMGVESNAAELAETTETSPMKGKNHDLAYKTGEQSMQTMQNSKRKQIVPSFAEAKNMLNERAQKLRITLPYYETEADSQGIGFVSRVTFNNVTYCSNGGFKAKKEAEKSAALEALKVLLQQEGIDHGCSDVISSDVEFHAQQGTYHSKQNPLNVFPNFSCPIQQDCGSTSISESAEGQVNMYQGGCSSTRAVTIPSSIGIPSCSMGMLSPPVGVSNVAGTVNQPPCVSYKNLLQEYMQQRGKINGPRYETTSAESGLFKSTVHFCGKSIESKQGYSTKKQAEQMVAMKALLDLGVEEPEKLCCLKRARDRTTKSLKQDFYWDSPPNTESRLRKRPRLDFPAPKRLKLQSLLVKKDLDHIDFLSVGEIWKEKKNVVMVGNSNTSFVLNCTRLENSLDILNTRIMENVELKPGYRIIGLDADLVQNQGRLVLLSERCADIEIPVTPDPVLISCGVVILHLDPSNSSHTEVLLKRYTDSQAFINVKAALAQFFRRSVSGHPLPLPIINLTEHIKYWTLEEVQHIAAMDVPALEQVFLNFWKFKDSWVDVLEPVLPKDLKDLQTRAQEELSRRLSCGTDNDDINDHPWGLPKGNFRHRMLSTGLHIEKPCECAARELREETGIQVDPMDLEKMPYVDVLQDDNLNPHKGDMARYFLYVYNPIIEELNSIDGCVSKSQPQSTNQTGQNVKSCEVGMEKEGLPLERKETWSKDKDNDRVMDNSNLEDDGIVASAESSYQETRQTSFLENIHDLSHEDRESFNTSIVDEEEMVVVCSALTIPPPQPVSSSSSSLPQPSSSSSSSSIPQPSSPLYPQPSPFQLQSSSSSPLLPHLQPLSLSGNKRKLLESKRKSEAELQEDKESSNYPVVHKLRFTPCMSSSPSSSLLLSGTKKTPLNTDYDTEVKEDSEMPHSNSNPPFPPMLCKGSLSNKDSEIKNGNAIQELTKISMENTSELKDQGLVKEEQGNNIVRNENMSSDILLPNMVNFAEQKKRGQKRKRDLLEEEESDGENDTRDDTQRDGTSTPTAVEEMSRYQSPTVQGAKHEECSWFSMDEALKVSPTFAAIYKTDKFSELLTLLKNKWT